MKPPVAGQAWCRKCFAGYQAKHRGTKLTQAEAAGFGKGVEAMRETLAREFKRLGGAVVTCFEVSAAIARSPRPTLQAVEVEAARLQALTSPTIR